MRAPIDPSTRSQTLSLLLATLLALLVSPQGLLAQDAPRIQEHLPQANRQPVEEGTVSVLGKRAYRAWGAQSNSAFCDFGQAAYGAYCQHSTGYRGYLAGGTYGVLGQHSNGNAGFLGGLVYSVYGQSNEGPIGFLGHDLYGAYGHFYDEVLDDFTNFGYLGGGFTGAYGEQANGNRGFLGGQFYGVYGQSTLPSIGGNRAGYFSGNVEITGMLTGGSAAFKVDHPLDPENLYLVHSFVESPDMMNVYNGTVTTDARGEAVVALPEYFEALNRDFRYQLTAIGGFAPLYIAEKISGNRFKIAGGTPGMEVSWQVTGIRQDRWANENRIVVEQDKPAKERGFYLHPQLYGQPVERSIEWARDPEGMRALQEMPARLKVQRRRIEQEKQQRDEERERMRQERECLREARGQH